MRAARPLFLHHSALSPEEYTPFILWLDELLPPPALLPTASSSTRTTPTSISDQDALEALIRVDDIGRFLLEKLHVEEEVWEDVLSIFHPNHRSLQPRNSISQSHLRALPPLKGGEVFVVFRLVGHSRLGKPVHIEGRKLAFWQAAPPLPSTEPSSSSSASKPYPPPRSTTKPPPPPQHLARKNSSSAPSSVIGHRSTPSLSKELPPQVSPQPPPPLNPNPFRRSSQPSSASPAKAIPTNAKGGPSSSDSDGLKKVTEDALAIDSSPSSSSSEDEGAEEVGRNHRRWQTPMSEREDSDSKHSGEGIRAGKPSSSSTKSGVQRSETTESFLTVSSSAFSPLVAAKLGLSSHSSSTIVPGGSPSPAHPPRPSTGSPLMINVDGSPSSNPFRTRLDSASGQSIPSDHSPISPPLPPRRRPSSVIGKSPSNPSSSTAPPLPPRDNATFASSSAQASAGDSSSSTTNSPSKPRPPPTKPPKPTSFTHSNSFHTTPLIQQSLIAAKGARKQEEMSAGRERKFEVIGSSSVLSSGARSGRSGSIAGGSSGTDGVGISPVPTGSGVGVGVGVGVGGGGGGKFATVNASIGLVGGGPGTRSHRSHSLVTSPFRSPPIVASARPEREYPFPQPQAQAPPPPPPSTVILQPSPTATATYAKPPPPLPPPQRRNSLYTHPSKPPPPPPTTSSSSVLLLNRHASLSSSHSQSHSRSPSSSTQNHHPLSRSNTHATPDPLKDGLRAVEHGVGWLRGAAVSSAGRVASASSGKGRRSSGRGGKVERERLRGSDEEEEGGEDSGEEERRERRRELEREEGEESWRRLD